jgi:hypothetical protein
MSAARCRLLMLCAVSLAVGLAEGTGYAQGQQEIWTTREYCIKVAPGKGREYEAFLRDVTVPLNQSRADAGEFEWFGLERGVAPVGSSARCDYRLAYTYKGLPPEETTNDQLDSALKRAGLNLSAEQMMEKRNALVQLVSLDFWYHIDGAGPRAKKGSYLRFNHHKVKNGQYDEYVRLERTWKALVEAWLKAGGKGSWVLVGLWMPGGDAVPYNGMTIDVFPDWDALMKGVPLDELWLKVHPNTPFAETENQKEKVRSVQTSELYKLVESVEKRRAASN